jgi:hypothetical protein
MTGVAMDVIRVSSLRKVERWRPTRWQGRLADGRAIDVRYDHGLLEIGLGETPEAAAADRRWCVLINDGPERSLLLPGLKVATWGVFAWPVTDDLAESGPK